MEHTHFWCMRCDTICGLDGYRRHMVEEHYGRSHCVLMLTGSQVLRVLRGETPFMASQTK